MFYSSTALVVKTFEKFIFCEVASWKHATTLTVDPIASTVSGVWPHVQNGYIHCRNIHILRCEGYFFVYDKALVIFNEFKKKTLPWLPSLVGEILGEVMKLILLTSIPSRAVAVNRRFWDSFLLTTF